MFGIWDSRTNSFYSLSPHYTNSIISLEETLADLERRGLWFEEASDECQDSHFETASGPARNIIAYDIYDTAPSPYTLALVSIP